MAYLRSSQVTRFLMTTCLIGGALIAPHAQAGGLEVSPTTLQITSKQSADGITLRNVGTTPIHAQVRVFAWSQKNNEDLLTTSNGITVSPPLLQIPPGTSQLLRVIRTSGAPLAGAEETYRLIIDEIPATTAAPAAAQAAIASSEAPKNGAAGGLDFYMRYSLPVFLGDSNDAPKTQLTWALQKSPKEWTLNVNNVGVYRAQIADVLAVLPDGSKRVLISGLAGYVLAGQSRHWSFPAPDSATKVDHFEAMINRDVQPLHVSSP